MKHLQSVENTTRKTDAQTAQGQLTSAQGRLINAEAQVSYANLRSPINGVVTDRPLFPGETASAGTPVITVMDTSSLLAKLHIAQSVAQKLKLGGTAELIIPGLDEPQSATVSLISPALDPGSHHRRGLAANSQSWGHVQGGHACPRSAASERLSPTQSWFRHHAILPAEDGGTNVLVVGSDGTAKKRSVKTRPPDLR